MNGGRLRGLEIVHIIGVFSKKGEFSVLKFREVDGTLRKSLGDKTFSSPVWWSVLGIIQFT